MPEAKENGCQPGKLNDVIIGQYPRLLTINSKEKLKFRKANLVLPYNVPNYHKEPGSYAHHLLYRVERREPSSYFAILNEPSVICIRDFNKTLTEPFSNLVDEAFLKSPKFDSYAQQEKDETGR